MPTTPALVCTPDEAKIGLLTHLLANRKHLLVGETAFSPMIQRTSSA